MKGRSCFATLSILATLVLALGDSSLALGQSLTEEDFFESKIRPVLVQTCFPCHGGKKTSASLKVDSRAALLKGGSSGPAIESENPDKSLLILALGYKDPDLKMPPGKRLPDATIDAFSTWVRAGAPWPVSSRERPLSDEFQSPKHWAFEPVRKIEPPPDSSGWSQHPIDQFITSRQRAAGLHPNPEADRRTLIRRASYDLIGLPPTPAEVESFLDDDRPDAFARVVNRLLNSPHYGERWGRHWMDIARYADTAGDNADYPVPEAVRYRDYIIDAFNSDKPFDQFIREQVAGDLIGAGIDSQVKAEGIVATGFLALSRRYATAPYELWHLTLEDTIEATGKAFLGLSFRCARCHDHKFDPVSQNDYYALYGIFASTTFPYAGSEEFISKRTPRMHFVPTLATEQAREVQATFTRRSSELAAEIAQLEVVKKGSRSQDDDARLTALKAQHERLRRLGMPPGLPTAYAVSEGKPTDVPVQKAGDPARPGQVVPRGVPRFPFLGMEPAPAPSPQASGRLELGRWLSRTDNPLTARVIANRIWQHHFGHGIVSTPSNFGLRGEPPSHPELLDWLAGRLVSSGWSIKDLHRQILMSRTYRLSSEGDSTSVAADPENRLLWRFERRRLDAESIRDGMLAVSGRLDLRKTGGHPFPPIEQWPWTQHNAFKEVYPTEKRSVYLMTQRLVKHPFLGLWDGPDTNTSTDVRTRSTVPLQALFLMHNPFVREQSMSLANRLAREADSPDGRIERLWKLAWGRPPSSAERELALKYLNDCTNSLTSNCHEPVDRERDAWVSLSRVILTANEFLYLE